MCGIAGLFDQRGASSADELAAAATRMADSLRHRGPDDGGVWADAGSGVAFGHRRLSIVDLSPDGHQPMASESGRFVLAYNGEVYNFPHLRRELEAAGHRFRGHSDTEILLAAFEEWGIDEALERSAGMFAMGIWDRRERQLHLVRDRLGKKPLYYGWVGDTLLFASELKAFHTFPGFRPEIDRGALALLLRHNCVPAPHTIFRGVFKLRPGSLLTLREGGAPASSAEGAQDHVRTYWSATAVAEQGARSPLALTEEEAVDQLEEVLGRAVGERMLADVPLGALLSGGIDSSAVVALMQRQAERPVKTFTIGLFDPVLDEAGDARRVAEHLGTEHTELYVTPEEAQAVIPRLPDFFDEPFADSSQIPTFLVCQLARRDVTVVLSGDGGDEVFGGYQRHFQAERLARYNRVPPVMRSAAARLLTAPSPEGWDRFFDAVAPVLPGRARRALSGDKVHKFAGVLPARGMEAAYRTLTSHWQEPLSVVRGGGGREPVTVLTDRARRPDLRSFAHVMMVLDTVSYLPDDILTKVDRASMAVSLEARAPLLDHRVVEFAWKLPLGMKIRGTQGKWILRQLLARHVPRELFERPKQGFGVPIGPWLRGPLRGWADALLAEDRLRDEGYFAAEPIRRKWSEHLAGRRNWAYDLWNVLMFQAWRERWAP
ncbi:MAG TPA: asparagine synthase (glutamine-hydrolyzing) [Longimicrobium sp.]